MIYVLWIVLNVTHTRTHTYNKRKQESPPAGNHTRQTVHSVTCPGGYPSPGWGVYSSLTGVSPRKDLGPETLERTWGWGTPPPGVD